MDDCNPDSPEVFADIQYVPRKTKGKKKRRSRAYIKVNTDQNSDNSDVGDVDILSELDESKSNQTFELEEDECNEKIYTDGHLKNGPLIPNEKILKEKVKHQSEENQELRSEMGFINPEEPAVKENETYNVRALSMHAKTYELEKFEKKILIIFNQEDVEGYEKLRYGTDKDVTALTSTFEKFGFEVTEYKDRTKAEIFDFMKDFGTRDFTDYGCVGIAVLTHGSDQGLLRAKDLPYSEMEIINHFKVHDKPTLVTKPKFLLIQACRGTKMIPGAQVFSAGKIRTDLDASTEPYILPVEADMLIVHSSFNGSPSHRYEKTGSWFIQSLCNKINELATENDLETIITEVKRNVAIANQYKKVNRSTYQMEVIKQMPVMTSTLIRKLYLKKFMDFPSQPLVTMSDSSNKNCHNCNNSSNDVFDFAPPNTPMLVQFGPCSCFLEHFIYMKNCLRYFVEENPDDVVASSYLEVAEAFDEGVNFNAAKEKLAKAMCKHLSSNARHCHYYKFLYFYKHY